MKFTKISRLISYSNHRNVSAEIELEENDTFEDADKALRNKLAELIDDEPLKKLLISEIEDLKFEVKVLKGYISEQKKILIASGFTEEYINSLDLPF